MSVSNKITDNLCFHPWRYQHQGKKVLNRVSLNKNSMEIHFAFMAIPWSSVVVTDYLSNSSRILVINVIG